MAVPVDADATVVVLVAGPVADVVPEATVEVVCEPVVAEVTIWDVEADEAELVCPDENERAVEESEVVPLGPVELLDAVCDVEAGPGIGPLAGPR